MKKLLIFVDWFAPGYKGGGNIQSCVNLSYALQEQMNIRVVTTDRDLGSEAPYENIRVDEWNRFDRNIQVLYLSPGKLGYKSIQSVIGSEMPDIIYLNSMFSFYLTLLPLEACRFNKWDVKVVLAPRGMLHAGALQYKKLKKKMFFHAFRARRFHKSILFHATDQTEATDIKKVFGKNTRINLVHDFPSSKQEPFQSIQKISGSLKCLFVSRISPKKNLLFLLSLLPEVKGVISLTIVGPAEDEGYWKECQQMIQSLSSDIHIHYLGPKPNHELSDIYRANHLFVLPTHGENFGHVIFESLINGRPVLISDLTPWKNLTEKNVGWEIPLADKAAFVRALTTASGWDQDTFDRYCSSAWKYASSYADTSKLEDQYLELFQ